MARQDSRDEVLYLRAAGVDLGKRFLVACVRVPNPRRAGIWALETERFDTTGVEVRWLLAWLTERTVEIVALEATSDYWRAVHYPLQDAGVNVMLVNPAHQGPQDGSIGCRFPGPRGRLGPSVSCGI